MEPIRYLTCILMAALLFTGCQEPEDIIPSTQTGDIAGFFLLNEGNMGSNKCTLDYYDYATGIYVKNIYAERNPGVVQELGDVGNDLAIYGSKLWVVVNCSNLVEVMDASTARHIGQISIPNCRYITFKDGYAYVSSYAGPVETDPNYRLGYVARIDTTTLQVKDTCVVGYQPEEMAVVDGKLYVANSGGYNVLEGKGYDRRVSVIDLKRFAVEREIEVAPNLWRLRADRYGQLWVTSRGNYGTRPGQLFLLTINQESGQMEVSKTFDLPVTDIAFRGDSLCYIGVDNTHEEADYYCSGVIHLRTHETVSNELVKGLDQLETPYGLMVHPLTGEVYVMDATNYVSNGLLICYDAAGRQEKWRTFTGDIPGHACWHIKTSIIKK